jgi:leader peptidase (prepilin peptidase)/N-methyltransferase
MLATLCIDWERMEVLPSLTLVAAASGIAAVVCEPQLLNGGANGTEALLSTLLNAIFAFVLLKCVALFGKLLFGKKRVVYKQAQRWTLQQEGDDLQLSIGSDQYAWSELFMEVGNRLILEQATEQSHTNQASGTIRFSVDHIILPDGTTEALENHEKLAGTCLTMEVQRAAMGSGDAWIALAIGALCGWEGVLFALVVGSVLGIIWAIISRIGRGEPMPFGPVFITAAWIYLFCGQHFMEKSSLFAV